MVEKAKRKLGSQVDGSSLAVFRIAFYLAVMWSVMKYVVPGSEAFRVVHVLPEMNFPYMGWEWVKPLPHGLLKAVYVLLAAGCFFAMLGVFYRAATVIVFVLYTYTFLLESSLFNNHYYLISLFSFLLIWMPSDRLYSVNSIREKRLAAEVPYWTVFLLRYQLLVVYVWGGIAKFNGDFLSGEAIIGSAQIFKDQLIAVIPAFDSIQVIHIAAGMAWIGLVFDLSIGFILWVRKTQWIGLILLAAFHGINHITLPIDVFPFTGFTASLIFLAPDWPAAFWGWIRRKLGIKKGSVLVAEPNHVSASQDLSRTVSFFIVGWIVFQSVLPLRHFTIPGDPSWTEEGQNYAWRMMLRQKAGGSLFLHVKDEGMFRADQTKRRIDWKKVPEGFDCKGVFVGVEASRMSWASSLGTSTLYENVIGFRIVEVMKSLDDESVAEEAESVRKWWDSKTGDPGIFREAVSLRQGLESALNRLQSLDDPDATVVAEMVGEALALSEDVFEIEQREARDNILRINDLLYMALQTKFEDELRKDLCLIKPFELLGIKTDQRFLVLAESPDAEGIQKISDELGRGDHFLIWCDFEKLRNYAWRGLPKWFVIFEGGELIVLSNYFPSLNRRQSEHLITKPYMIYQYAQRIAASWENETGRRPVINGHGSVMMNYRQPQSLFRPDLDLASADYHIWKHNDWILPLKGERIGIAERIAKEEERIKRIEDKGRE